MEKQKRDDGLGYPIKLFLEGPYPSSGKEEK
jgi:hypothetical protein